MKSTDLEKKLVEGIIGLSAELHEAERRDDLSISDQILVKHAVISIKIS